MEDLPLTCEIKIDGSPREIFMSYGLLTTLSKIFKSPEEVVGLGFDHELRDAVMLSLLAERNEGGKITSQRDDITDYAISLLDADKLLTWAMMHLTDFFVQGAIRAKALLDHQTAKAPQI